MLKIFWSKKLKKKMKNYSRLDIVTLEIWNFITYQRTIWVKTLKSNHKDVSYEYQVLYQILAH